MKRLAIAALCAGLIAAAPAAGAYESRDIEEIERAAPVSPAQGVTPGEPSGSPTQDEWRRNEVPVVVTGRIVDGKRGYPLDRARVLLMRRGGPPHEVARTDVTGGVYARYLIHDPPPEIRGAAGAVSTEVLVRVERPGYLPFEGAYGPGSLPKKGRYAWIDLGDLRMRALPIEPEEP